MATGRRFYVYENWQAGRVATTHRGECRFCNEGAGIHPGASDRNGQWHGPFVSIEAALAARLRHSEARRRRCSFCCRR